MVVAPTPDVLAVPPAHRACSADATVPVPLGPDFALRRRRADRDRRARAGPGRGAQLAQQPDRLGAARGRGRAGAGRDRRAGGLRRGLPGIRRPDGAPAAGAQSSRLVVLRTFSKALGMAGLRFGLALAHPAVAREIAKGEAALQREPRDARGRGGGAPAPGRRSTRASREIVETARAADRAARGASGPHACIPARPTSS